MQHAVKDALCLIKDTLYLLKEESILLASPEDAAYFRSQKLQAAPPEPLNPKPSLPPPLIIEKAKTTEKPSPLKEPPQPTIVPLPPAKNPNIGLSHIRAVLKKTSPDLKILEQIPDDAKAKQIAERWKTKNQSASISLLSYGEPPEHKKLLQEIAATLEASFGDARLIEAEPLEKENLWETFFSSDRIKLLIVCDVTLWQLHKLRGFYKENPVEHTRKLGGFPLLFLPDLSLYFKDPSLKRSLWKALCQKLAVS